MARNMKNMALALTVPIPAFVFYLNFLRNCNGSGGRWGELCAWGRKHPMSLLNVLFFLNVDVLFWVISVIQQSTWLIDPYWTFIPVMIGGYCYSHPAAVLDYWRSEVVMTLLWLWSIRLTHSYFRRENWQWGQREDWRFADYRQVYGRNWWWISFFLTYASQHVFLLGVCVPLYLVHTSNIEWGVLDTLASILCGTGIIISYMSDTELHNFVVNNKLLKELGVSLVPILDSGLWHYSRHPNYFGEQLWWWSLGLFACNVGHPWALMGALLNSLCLGCSAILVERRMVREISRARLYREYQRSTSFLVPWFKSKCDGNNCAKKKSS